MFDWQDYLALARRLFEHPPEPHEATWRTVASRAYYAAFHRCRLKLPERERDILRPGTHGDLLRALRRQPETQEAADTINRLLRLRVHADYQPAPFPRENAALALLLGEGLV